MAKPRTRRAIAANAFTVGREAFARISAVEGIQLSRELEERFLEFDRRGLSPAQRRAELARHLGEKR